MKVAILCENLFVGTKILDALQIVDAVKISVWVTRHPKELKAIFLARQIKAFFCVVRHNYLPFLWKHKFKFTINFLHAHSTISQLKSAELDVGLHAAGVIYKHSVIECFSKGILNPHIGLLPRYRGRSVMEWSLLENHPTGITTFFIDEGIDTGTNIVLREEVAIKKFSNINSAKNYLFSKDGEMFAKALHQLQRSDFFPLLQKPEQGRRYYVMSNLFKECVEEILKTQSCN